MLSPAEQLKQEFKKVKETIPDISIKKFTDFVTTENKSYENREGIARIRNTFYGYAGDYNLLNLLIKYKDEFAN